ncbi:hypothetical protein OAS19_02965 [Altererythrobacter sp.]|nr:hypothetical protein [Altererythrobacter sp.]
MSDDLTRDSERLLTQGRSLVQDNQNGGRHRKVQSIGKGSADIKLKTWIKRAGYFGAALVAIIIAASVAGVILNGIGFVGIMTAFLAMVAAGVIFANYPKVKIPKRAELNKGDVRQMVARTELWLENQRAALPAPAVKIVETLGVQLDALGAQLANAPADHQVTREIRQLVGETLPEMIDSYRKIPANLRTERRGAVTPDEQVTEGLAKISKEIDQVTRQLAEGSLDDLAVKHRYLDYKYGEGLEDNQDTGVPLPDFNLDKTKAPG